MEFIKWKNCLEMLGSWIFASLHPLDWGGDTASAAMNSITGTNVLIIDLRKCRGGDPGMVCFLLTYFFGVERVHLNDFYLRKGSITEQYWTLPDVPGKRFGEKPVYILTSAETFSGGEEFAYDLKALKRATVIWGKDGRRGYYWLTFPVNFPF